MNTRRNRSRFAFVPIAVLMVILGGHGLAQDGSTKKAKDRAPTAAQLKIAEAISNGHSYQKHVIDEEQFPEIKSRADFARMIARVLANPSHSRELANDREAFYDERSNTLVIVNPHAKDRGTCFRPSARKRYYDNLK